jgi:hypothetical protein
MLYGISGKDNKIIIWILEKSEDSDKIKLDFKEEIDKEWIELNYIKGKINLIRSN